ncbi:MAG: SNF2-related protein [Bacilli bacterium]
MFKNLNLKSTYSTYEDDIGQEFYSPVLSRCVTYDRATAYFSAKSLSNYAQGLEVFSKNGYKYRLIISTEISENDYNEIVQGYKLRDELKSSFLKKLEADISLQEEMNLSNLAYLISIGTVDIKMAFTKSGIFHDKFGIMKDNAGNIICFRGSNNETDAAFKANYESFDITCSWQSSTFDFSKITKSIEVFENLWNNSTEDIFVCTIDNIIRDKILSYNRGNIVCEPILLKDNCVVLDYKDTLELIIKIEPRKIINSPMYKMSLKKYIDEKLNTERKIFFKSNYTYPTFKKIIEILEKDSKTREYDFFVTERLKKKISDRELYIRERSNVGLSIKNQQQEVLKKYNDYKEIVNKEMDRQLREKQMWDSFYMCVMKKSCNFSVPGSGKTSSVLGVYAYLSNKGFIDKVIMIGPKNSFGSWIDEFKICFKNKRELREFNIQNYKSVEEKKYSILYKTGNKNLLLFNYESLGSILDEISGIIDSNTLLVFDEAHKIKAIQGQRAENALIISKKAYFTIAMTGTPIPNSYADLKNILNILYCDEYNDFFKFSDIQLKNPNKNDIEEINNKLQPFFCRTTKEQLSVPAANKDIIIDTMANNIESRIFDILCMKYAKKKLVLFIRILQLESNPRLLLEAIENNCLDFSDILCTQGTIDDIEYKDYSDEIVKLINSISKTTKFDKCIEEAFKLVSQGKSIIIWCIFIDSILNIKTELRKKGVSIECIFGNTDNDERNYILERFKLKEIDILITNPHTLAESISLHGVCHDAIYFEYSYNLVHLLQSKDRIHRLGLSREQYTQYYYLQNYYVTSDGSKFSLDNRIYERLLEKENTMLKAIENNIFEPITSSDEDIAIVFNNLKL